MRITGGKYRSRRLLGSVLKGVRPSSSKNRQAVFNILGNNLKGKAFLDGFCGTGIMGLEALSRGASKVIWVDINRKNVQRIRSNLKFLNMDDTQTRLMCCSIEKAFAELKNISFDVIYLDPPFKLENSGENLIERLGTLILENELLTPGGTCILEHSGSQHPRFPESGYECQDSRRYGSVGLQFWRLK